MGACSSVLVLGAQRYLGIAIPSLACNLLADYKAPQNTIRRWLSDNYYNLPWERTADLFGGVNRFGGKNLIEGYKEDSVLWSIIENILGPITIPFYFKYGY